MLKINYGLLDITAADDAVSSASGVQDFANAQDINTPDLDRLEVRKFGDLEQNLWLLDGTFEQWPENPAVEKWGFWSKAMSDKNGVFSEPPQLTVEFDDNHSTEGLTMYFRPDTADYSTDFTIDYYDSADNLIASHTFSATGAEYFADGPAEDYKKIVFTFRKTSLPYRYMKLSDVKYGSIKIFDEDSIISATILEEIDVTGTELSINTMECTIYTSDFQLLDPQGIYMMLQQKQAINVKDVDEEGNFTEYGTFFLEEPTSEDDDTTTLKCVDFLGVIDKTEFLGGIYENKNAGELFDEIMVSAEVEEGEYEVEEELRAKSITGWIPICTHREAVHQWAFAVGAVVDCARAKKIKAYTPKTEVYGTLTHEDKFIGHKVVLRPLVTGVKTIAHKYTVDATSSVAYEGTLPVGDNLVTFSSPYTGISVSGGTMIKSGANYAVVRMTAVGTVKISGKRYIDSTSVYAVNAPELPANTKPSILDVTEDATLINADNALEIAQRVYDWHQNRYQDEGDIVLGDQRAGYPWRMNSLNGRDILGRFTRLEIDLVSETANVCLIGKSAEREGNA